MESERGGATEESGRRRGGLGAMARRAIRAARLDAAVYSEIAADPAATWQAVTVVLLSSVASALGFTLGREAPQVAAAVGETVFFGLLGWIVWTFGAQTSAGRLFRRTSRYQNLLRAAGFASAPGALRLVAVIPVAGGALAFFAWTWMLAAQVLAVRGTLNLTLRQALVSSVLGWLGLAIVRVAVQLGISLSPWFSL